MTSQVMPCRNFYSPSALQESYLGCVHAEADPGGGLRGLQPPLWEVFELVWSQLDDEVEGIHVLGERHFISQIPWK